MNHITKRRKKMKTKNNQSEVAGSHYEKLNVEPVILFREFNLNWFQGEIIKYVSRFKNKNGLQDLNKASHIAQMAIDLGIKGIPYSQYLTEGGKALIGEYTFQFANLFSLTKDDNLNKRYYIKFVDIIYFTIRGEWETVWSDLEDLKYYFYGEEEV